MFGRPGAARVFSRPENTQTTAPGGTKRRAHPGRAGICLANACCCRLQGPTAAAAPATARAIPEDHTPRSRNAQERGRRRDRSPIAHRPPGSPARRPRSRRPGRERGRRSRGRPQGIPAPAALQTPASTGRSGRAIHGTQSGPRNHSAGRTQFRVVARPSETYNCPTLWPGPAPPEPGARAVPPHRPPGRASPRAAPERAKESVS